MTIADVRLEPLRWWHAPACAALEQVLFGSDPWSEATFWSELARAPESRWYVAALRDGELVGYAGLAALPPEADVQTIAVAPSAQGGGLGSRLLTALIEEAGRRGCTQVMLEVRAGNAAALALYGRRGFVALSRRRDYYAPGEDAVVMRLSPLERRSEEAP